MEASLIHEVDSDEEDSEVVAYTNILNAQYILPRYKSLRYEPLPHDICLVYTLREEDAPKVELKKLPLDLRHAFLGPNSIYPIIVNV